MRILCDYKYIPWPVIGNAYSCQVKNLNLTQPNQSITKVSGNHLPRLTDTHVRAFDICRQTSHFMLQRIKNFFSSIELLQVQNSKLKVITQADLKPFSKLRVLHLGANHLEALERNLFLYNPDLVRIDFKHQKLKLISYNILDNLIRLALADFQSSGCVDFYAQAGREGIGSLKKEIRINCQPIDDLISEVKELREKVGNLDSGESSAKLKILEYDSEPVMKKLDVKFTKMQEDNVKCMDGLEVVTKNFHALTEKMKTLEKSLGLKLEESDKETCGIHEIANQKCTLENENLQRLKRETSIVNLECEKVEWAKLGNQVTCNIRNLKITQPDVDIKNVSSGSQLQGIDARVVEEVKAFNQQASFLPLKLAEHFPNLKLLIFVDCKVMVINEKAFSGLKNLRSLNLSHNKIGKISATDLKDLAALNSLDISYNKIENFDEEALQALTELFVLKLNDNLLSDLTAKIFIKLSKLKFLMMQNNKLAIIEPNILNGLIKLEFADFSNNKCVDVAASKTSTITLKVLATFFSENCSDLKILF